MNPTSDKDPPDVRDVPLVDNAHLYARLLVGQFGCPVTPNQEWQFTKGLIRQVRSGIFPLGLEDRNGVRWAQGPRIAQRQRFVSAT